MLPYSFYDETPAGALRIHEQGHSQRFLLLALSPFRCPSSSSRGGVFTCVCFLHRRGALVGLFNHQRCAPGAIYIVAFGHPTQASG